MTANSKLLWAILPFFVFLSGAEAFGGAMNGGGGGGAYVCRDGSKTVESAELLDLFEVEHAGQAVAYDDATPVDIQVTSAIQLLGTVDSSFGSDVLAAWKFIQTHKVSEPNDSIIPAPTDADPNLLKAGCPLVGMMYFDDLKQRLFIQQDIFDAQKRPTAFAASYVHESIYKVLRNKYNAHDSHFARELTGCLFSNDFAGCLNLSKIVYQKTRRFSVL